MLDRLKNFEWLLLLKWVIVNFASIIIGVITATFIVNIIPRFIIFATTDFVITFLAIFLMGSINGAGQSILMGSILRNKFAWLLATVDGVQRLHREEDALRLAREAVRLHASASYRDTLACAYALVGRLEEAIEIEASVVADDKSVDYQRRLEKFRSNENCIGEE